MAASDPMFDPPTIFVMEPADLELPQHPDQNTTWFCVSKATRIFEDLNRGINPEQDVSEDNLPRILTRYMLPYLENLKAIADEVLARAEEAQTTFLVTNTDILFDNFQLTQTIKDIREYHKAVNAYLHLTTTAESGDDFSQVQFLNDQVLKPLFGGAGFAVIGDENSEWITFAPVYCDGIKLASDLNKAVEGHIKKWKGMGWNPSSGESIHGKSRSTGGQLLGVLALVGVAVYLSKK
jgi:hypothetical protein